MNEIEQLLFSNYVLFYADYLSLQKTYTPITDTCKYYYILDCPINTAYIVNLEPVYDENNKYYITDIITEGISFISSQRSEVNSIINSKGFDAFLTELETKNNGQRSLF